MKTQAKLSVVHFTLQNTFTAAVFEFYTPEQKSMYDLILYISQPGARTTHEMPISVCEVTVQDRHNPAQFNPAWPWISLKANQTIYLLILWHTRQGHHTVEYSLWKLQ